MRTPHAILAVYTLLAAPIARAGELPELLNASPLAEISAPAAIRLPMAFALTLAPGRHLNEKAPSRLRVYEKRGADWAEVSVTDVKTLDVAAEPRFASHVTPIVFDLVVYHCADTCSVTSYRGTVARNPAKRGPRGLKLALQLPEK